MRPEFSALTFSPAHRSRNSVSIARSIRLRERTTDIGKRGVYGFCNAVYAGNESQRNQC
jgi:hypothetical protein